MEFESWGYERLIAAWLMDDIEFLVEAYLLKMVS